MVGLLETPARDVEGILAVRRDDTAHLQTGRALRKRVAEGKGAVGRQPAS